MKVVLLGASGFVGSVILKEALDRGHRLTAVVRNQGHLIPTQQFRVQIAVSMIGSTLFALMVWLHLSTPGILLLFTFLGRL